MNKKIAITLIIGGLILGGLGLTKSFDRSASISTKTIDLGIKSQTHRNQSAIYLGLGLLLLFGGALLELKRRKSS